jgi:phage shock protein E
MADKEGRRSAASGSAGRQPGRSRGGGFEPAPPPPANWSARAGVLIVAVIVVVLVVLAADFVFGSIFGTGATSAASVAPAATPAGSAVELGVVVQGQGGHWTNVTPDQLAQMLDHKDFTLVNVKTPYIGEIVGTDLYIPYDQLKARASQLPQDKSARLLVYCRSGAESAQAAQTLLDLGYTNVWNLDGGMNAWQASGRALIQVNR